MKPTSLLVCNYKPWRLIALVLLLSTGFVRAIPLAVAPPGWSVDPGAYQYSMNIVARASYLGVPTNAAGNIVGVFVGNELRGVATPVDVSGVAYYFITVYSNKSSGETLRFKVYYQPNDAVYTSLELRTFQPQAIVGTLVMPFWIPVDNTTDVPPALEDIPGDTTLVGIPFETIDLADYLVSDDGDPVVYSAVPGANLTASISGSVLTVTPVSGTWTGTDTVRVVATEQTANMKRAATTPRFTVQPFYNPPLLGAIPPQQINVGQQFIPYDLDESLTFTGPCRAFDYFITPFSGADAAPAWSAPSPGAGSMTIVARPLFDDLQLAGAGAELAAFRSGLLVGKAGPSGVAPNVLYNLTLANQGSGNITFKLYDADRQYLYTLDADLPFVAGGSAGTSGAPYLLQFCPLTPAINSSGVVTIAINQPNWLGDLSVNYVVWDCPYAALSARRDTAAGVYTMFYSPNPAITSASSVNFQENTCLVVYDAEAYDPNYTAGNSLRYRISGGADQSRFRLDSITGKLNWNNFIPNFETPADANADNRYLVTIQVRNPDNLTGEVNLEVVVTDNPVESFSPAVNNGATVCLSPTAVLTASGGGTYLWSTGQTSASIGVTLPGVYSVTVTNNVQCTGVASAAVIADSAPTVSCPPASAIAYTVAGATCQTMIPDYVSLLVPTDACSVTLSEVQSIPPGAFPVSDLGNVIQVVYAATDISSNSTRCTVSLTVNDDDAPTVGCPPAAETINLNAGSTNEITIPNYVAGLNPSDNCTISANLTESQSIPAGSFGVPGNGATVTVVYTVTDQATPPNTTTCTVVITAGDNQPPVVSCPGNTTIETNTGAFCQITIPDYVSLLNPTDNVTATNDLNETQSIPTGAFGVSGDGATVTVTYTVTDDATPANSASCQVVLTVDDNDAPTFTCPTPASLTLNTTGGVNCAVNIPDLVALVTDAADNCSLAPTPITQSIPAGANNGVSDGNMIPVTVTVTDAAMPVNTASCVITFIVNDDDAPTVGCPPATATIATNGANCTIAIPDYVTALSPTDNCTLPGDLSETQSVPAGAFGVSGDGATVTVAYTVTDDAIPANSTNCQVLITVNDDDAPTVTCPAATTTIFTNAGSSCEITIPNYISDLSPTDNCTLAGDLHESQSVPGGAFGVSGAGATVAVTYTVTDDATPANSASCQVVITVNDNDAPTITGAPEITLVEGCSLAANPAAATTVAALEALTGNLAILDNCAADNALSVTYSDTHTGVCPIVITRTYTITDPSGNSATMTHTIHVDDTTPPAITGDLDPTALTLCNVWDTTGPAATVAALKMLDADADLNISDACTPDGSLSVACTSTITGAKPTFTLTRTYSITDLCGNTAFLTHVIQITVTCFTISGRLLHSKSLPSQVSVSSADVRMAGSQAGALTSGADGQFTFGINTSGFVSHTVTIWPRKLSNKLNGVTSADVTRIQQHIVGMAPFTDPFDLIASDLNKSKSINSTDASILSQALRNNQAALLQFDSSWRFVAGNHSFPPPPYFPTPATTSAFWNFPPLRSYTNLTQDMGNQLFFGVKLGDVSVTYANPATRPAKANPLILVANDRLLRAGEETTVSVRVLNFTDIAALQFVLAFDNSRLEFINLTTPPSSPFIPEHFGLFNLADGEIRAVWSIVQGLDIQDGNVVLNLTFKALEDHVRLSEALSLLDDEVLPREAYSTDLSPRHIELQFIRRARPTGVASRDGGESAPEASPAVLLLQNQPNPFHDQTTIGFVLGEPMHARLRVFDLTGRLLFERAAQYPAGYQAVEFRMNQDAVPGLLMVELTTKYGTQTRKMNVY